MENWSKADLKNYLDEKADTYESVRFLESDPLGVVHRVSDTKDIELFGLLVALIAWGNRKSIIQSAENLLHRLEYSPYCFLLECNDKELQSSCNGFVHRTFNANDLYFLLSRLRTYYLENDSISHFFNDSDAYMHRGISKLRAFILQTPHENRFDKHIADPSKGSAAKRIHLYLRWMVRSSKRGVDFGIWSEIPSSKLSCPLDVHSGRVAKTLGLLNRKQNDLKALNELDTALRAFDPIDPVRYDFALFGIGAFEQF